MTFRKNVELYYHTKDINSTSKIFEKEYFRFFVTIGQEFTSCLKFIWKASILSHVSTLHNSNTSINFYSFSSRV